MKELWGSISPTNKLIRETLAEQAVNDIVVAAQLQRFFSIQKVIDEDTKLFLGAYNSSRQKAHHMHPDQARHLLECAFWALEDDDLTERNRFRQEWGQLAEVGISRAGHIREKLNTGDTIKVKTKDIDKKARNLLPTLHTEQKRRLLKISGFSDEDAEKIVSVIPESLDWTLRTEGFKELATIGSSILLANYLRDKYGDIPTVDAMLLGDAVYYTSQTLLNAELIRVLDKTGNCPNAFIVSADIYTADKKPLPKFLTKMIAGYGTELTKEAGWRAYAVSGAGPLPSDLVYLVGSFVNASFNLTEIAMLEVYIHQHNRRRLKD